MRFPNGSAASRVCFFTLASCAALLTSGCGLNSDGLAIDTPEGDGDAGGSSFDATFPTGDSTVTPSDDTGTGIVTGNDATGVGSPPVDAGDGSDANKGTPPVVEAGVDACTGSVEICNNGIDDDCDGKIDCADPQCGPAAWQCTAQAVPAGWTVVSYSASPTAAECNAAYATSSSVYEAPFAPAACACTCGLETSGSCDNGTISVLLGNGIAPCSGVPASYPVAAGTCEPIATPFPLPAGEKEQITPAAYTAGTCAGTNQGVGQPTKPVINANGHVCAETTTAGAGCPNSGACVPAVQTGYSLCIAHAAVDGGTCPPGFSTTVHDVGTGIDDARTCSTCACGAPTAQCTNAVVSLFGDAQCDGDGGTGSVVANGVCNAIAVSSSGGPPPATSTFHAYEYTATVANEACGPGTSTPGGSVGLTGPTLICCQ